MTDTKNIWASITSDDYIIQDFPYEGHTYAHITVRYMEKYGYDVIIRIDKGQISGSKYNGKNYVIVRFDDKSPQMYYYNEAADYSSDHIFIKNTSDFITNCKKAKKIIVQIPIYKAGGSTFTFTVDEPLIWRTE